jgi:hypothetical protein
MPHETSIMNTSSDITNIENDPEVIFVHALNRSTYILNNPLLVFSHFRKKLDILISIASFFGNSKMYCGLHFLFRQHISTREIPCINKT